MQGHLSPGRVSGSPVDVHGGVWRLIQLSSRRVSILYRPQGLALHWLW